jgi:hypothetical protein
VPAFDEKHRAGAYKQLALCQTDFSGERARRVEGGAR